MSEPRDLLEISLFSYLVDAVLDSSPDIIKAMRAWVLGETSSDTSSGLQQFRARDSLIQRIRPGVERLLADSDREDFRPFVDWFCDLMQTIPRPVDNSQSREVAYYTNVVNYASQILGAVEDSTFLDNLHTENPFGEIGHKLDLPRPIPPKKPIHRRVRVCIYGCLALLWAVHTRLNGLRRKGLLNREGTNLLSKIEELLKKDYDKQWYEAIKRFHEM